jgi:hypothetical protein
MMSWLLMIRQTVSFYSCNVQCVVLLPWLVPLVMSTFGKLGPAAEGYLQNLATVACSTGVVDRGVWLRISRQYLSCAVVRGRGIVFRHYYRSLAKSAGKDFRDGAVVPFE